MYIRVKPPWNIILAIENFDEMYKYKYHCQTMNQVPRYSLYGNHLKVQNVHCAIVFSLWDKYMDYKTEPHAFPTQRVHNECCRNPVSALFNPRIEQCTDFLCIFSLVHGEKLL